MHIFSDILSLQAFLLPFQKRHQTIGFVPTMGALHEGHLSLVRTSKAECDLTVVSIFVNPTQFGPKEDLSTYPRTLGLDEALLRLEKVEVLFLPTEEVIYPFGKEKAAWVEVPVLSKLACGKSRPHHFRGVTSVVNRLFNCVKPNRAYFGEKDFQQCVIIQRMVSDLHMGVRIVPCPILRESDGLALSSRNRYLTSKERQIAPQIFRALCEAKQLFISGEDRASVLIEQVLKSTSFMRLDYVMVVDSVSFKKKKKVVSGDRVLFAGFLGHTRLIDNVAL